MFNIRLALENASIEHDFYERDEDGNIIYLDENQQIPQTTSSLKNTHIRLQQVISEHFDLPVHTRTHMDAITLGGEEVEVPSILLLGPDLNRGNPLQKSIVIDTGISEEGYFLTREYKGLEYYVLNYGIELILDNHLEMIRFQEGLINFFQRKKGIRVGGVWLTMRLEDPPSRSSALNLSNLNIASATFRVENVLVIDPYKYTDSGRVHEVKFNWS